MEKQRARLPEEKEARKQSIVESLKQLLIKSPHPLPSMNEVANAAGVTKGVIYHYFKSREEIFLTLYSQEAEVLFSLLHSKLAVRPYHRDLVKAAMIEQFSNNDLFMNLGILAPTIMEAGVSAQFLIQFKLENAMNIDSIAKSWLPLEQRLTLDLARKFLMRFYYLSLNLWQHHHPPASVIDAFKGKDLWLVAGDLDAELRESFDWLWRGMMGDTL